MAKDVLRIDNADTVTYSQSLQTAQSLESLHLDSLKAIRFPQRERQTIQVGLKNGDSYYYDPGNGQYLGKNPSTASFLIRFYNCTEIFAWVPLENTLWAPLHCSLGYNAWKWHLPMVGDL